MDSENTPDSSSFTASSTSSSPEASAADRASRKKSKCGTDLMVRIELEAAEALADLAQSAVRKRENSSAESGGQWGSQGKRACKRLKDDCPVIDSEKAVHKSSELAKDQARAVTGQQLYKSTCTNGVINIVKSENDAELPKPSPVICTSSYVSFGGGKPRQNLTEDEKEARRLRRILANRESARQTIRRRQALCEELSRKAADLTWENDNLKREKQLAIEEYQNLKTANELLKSQVEKIINAKAEDPDLSNHMEIPNSLSTDCPLLLYNQHSFAPILWPSIFEPSNPTQSQNGPQNAISIISTGKRDSTMPLFVVPIPWFFPPSELQPHLTLEKQDEACLNEQCSSFSSSKDATNVDKTKTEASTSIVAMPVKGMTLKPAFMEKHENGAQADYINNVENIASVSSPRTGTGWLERKPEVIIYPKKKLVDTAAAADARKRRKELKKLKNIHGRRCRMHS